MKQRFTILIILLTALASFAQQGINYKALIKDDLGNVIVNQTIGVKFTISFGVGETTLYEEEHYPQTDENGIIIVNIGEGNDLFGSFNTIDWSLGDIYNLRTAIDINGGTNYTDLNSTPLKKVPFAAIANTIKDQSFKTNGTTITPINISNDFVIGSTQLDNDDTFFGTPRLFFDRSNSALRAGHTSTEVWDAGNRGQYSFACGTNTLASGSRSTAMGNRTQAIGYASTALGNNTIASGSYATGLGSFNEIDPNGLLMVGNGTSEANRNTVFTIKSNGDTIFKEQVTFDGNSIFQGDATLNGNTTFNNNPVVNADLEITGDILMNFTSEVQNPSTGFANLVPIAYGSVNASGTVAGGTGNFTVTEVDNIYTITVVGKTLTRQNTSVHVIANTSTFRNANATFSNGKLLVHLFTSSFSKVQSDFQFTIYQE